MLDNRQTNRFQMLLATQNYLAINQLIWVGTLIVSTFKAELDALILGIRVQLKSTGVETTGITIGKNEMKEQIGDKAAVLSGALTAFASVNGNHDLGSNGYLSKSDVTRMRDVELPEMLAAFIDRIGPQMPALAEYGVTEAQLTALAEQVDDFRELIGLPRLTKSLKDAAKREAGVLIDRGALLLTDKMDKVMLQFKESNPVFYDGYQRARMIVDH